MDSGTKLVKKGLKQKKEHQHLISHIRNSLGTKFQFKRTILIFWTKLKGVYCLQNNKMKMTIEFYIFELVYIPNFSFSNFDFFKQICYKKQ